MPGWYRIIEIMDTFFTGTISLETSDTRIVFLGMLSLADRNGEVHAPALGIARWVNLPIETVEASLVRLMAPDPGSTSKGEEGRRILSIGPNEWKLVNYEKYRDIIRREKKKAIDAQRAYEKYHAAPSPAPTMPPKPKSAAAANKPSPERVVGVPRSAQPEGEASIGDVLGKIVGGVGASRAPENDQAADLTRRYEIACAEMVSAFKERGAAEMEIHNTGRPLDDETKERIVARSTRAAENFNTMLLALSAAGVPAPSRPPKWDSPEGRELYGRPAE